MCHSRPNGVQATLTLAYQFRARAGVVVAACVFLASCSGTTNLRDANLPLQIGVDYSSLEPVNVVVNLYESKQTEQVAHILVQGRASLMKALEQGDLESIFVLGESALTEYFRTPVVRLDVTFIANPNIEFTTLTYDEIVKVFNGEISNWQMLNGPAMPVQVVAYPALSSERIVIEELGFGIPPSNALTGNSPEDVTRLVATEPGAIGYIIGTPPVNSVTVLVIAYQHSFGPIGLLQPQLPQVPVLFVSLKQPSGDMRILLDLALTPETQAQIGSGH